MKVIPRSKNWKIQIVLGTRKPKDINRIGKHWVRSPEGRVQKY
jgi:hypothetical protein